MRVRSLCLGVGLLISLPVFAADTSPPTQPSVNDDGIYTSSSNGLHATWMSSDSGSGIAEYQYRIRRDSTSGTTIVDWTSVGLATEVTRNGLSLANGKKYFIGVRAKNGAGLWSSTGYSNGITIDTTAPSTVSVTDDGATTSSNTQLHATWTASSDSGSGLLEYQYLIRQDSTSGAIIVNWTSVGLAREVNRAGLSLIDGKTYFVGVRAQNRAGLYSSSSYSNGITVQSAATPPPPNASYQGFGAGTLGGEGKPLYRVTNLNDSGPGSLRDAVSQGNRYIVFDVGGVIETLSRLNVKGANITIDGFTAPIPGITIKNYGLWITGLKGAHDIIVQGIRVEITSDIPEAETGIMVRAGAYNVVIQNVSIRGASDEGIGILDTHDVTVAWSILADPIASHNSNLIITEEATRISLHHNLFAKSKRRNPWVAYSCPDCTVFNGLAEAPELQADIRNNLMWDVSGGSSNHGTVVYAGGKANIIGNYYKAANGLTESGEKRVIVVCRQSGTTSEDMEFCGSRLEYPPARAFVAGNFSADGWTDHINTKGTEANPFSAPAIDTTDAITACQHVLANAGVRPLDSIDQQYLSLVSCP